MKYITGEDRYQIAFLPDCIEDYVSKDNPVRVVDAFVNQLDMDKLRLNGITSDTMSYAGGKKKSQRFLKTR